MIRNVEYADRKKLQKTYLDGLRRYKCRGIPIIIDGEECPEKDWERIFEMSEDGGFYMGDYVGASRAACGRFALTRSISAIRRSLQRAERAGSGDGRDEEGAAGRSGEGR